jgi:pyruvate/2-oxoglutarate dehydrogenase complex dihydrolipoamide dehydrogenase (E3) component
MVDALAPMCVYSIPEVAMVAMTEAQAKAASELIHLGQLVLHEGAPIDRFIHATFAVPSRSEAYKYAAYDGLMRLDRARQRLASLQPTVSSQP